MPSANLYVCGVEPDANGISDVTMLKDVTGSPGCAA
jgi:hypothetical protein